MPDLTVRNACLAYGRNGARVQALDDVCFEASPGRFTLVAGPSGSGKTSLLSVMGCITAPDSGRVWVKGIEATRLDERRRCELRLASIGFVFQAFRLMRSLSAEENVALGLSLRGWRAADARSRARQLLAELGLLPRAGLVPDEMSGGEKQRVAVARALAPDPEILLADEPTASLDSTAGAQIARLFRRIAEQQGRIVVAVSHDERLRSAAHQTIQMRDGKIVEVQS